MGEMGCWGGRGGGGGGSYRKCIVALYIVHVLLIETATQNVNVSDNNAIFNDLNNIPNSFPYCVYCVYTCTFFFYFVCCIIPHGSIYGCQDCVNILSIS